MKVHSTHFTNFFGVNEGESYNEINNQDGIGIDGDSLDQTTLILTFLFLTKVQFYWTHKYYFWWSAK